MTSGSLARPALARQSTPHARVRLVDRSPLDQFIVGLLIVFLLVYAYELMLLVPCGSFADMANCDLPPASKQFWSTYFQIDPLFAQMPPYYVAIMSMQDYLYNPWWALCLFMFFTNRQDAPWHASITLLVTGMIVATSSVIFGVQLQHPHYTATIMTALLMINGPWIAGPLLISWRLRHGRHAEVATPTGGGSVARAGVLLALPFVLYTLLSLASIALTGERAG